jgi:hypothetical protein
MAKLTTKVRKKLPEEEFGEPQKGAYPMPDKAHAGNAKARATQMVKKGKLSVSKKLFSGRSKRQAFDERVLSLMSHQNPKGDYALSATVYFGSCMVTSADRSKMRPQQRRRNRRGMQVSSDTLKHHIA